MSSRLVVCILGCLVLGTGGCVGHSDGQESVPYVPYQKSSDDIDEETDNAALRDSSGGEDSGTEPTAGGDTETDTSSDTGNGTDLTIPVAEHVEVFAGACNANPSPGFELTAPLPSTAAADYAGLSCTAWKIDADGALLVEWFNKSAQCSADFAITSFVIGDQNDIEIGIEDVSETEADCYCGFSIQLKLVNVDTSMPIGIAINPFQFPTTLIDPAVNPEGIECNYRDDGHMDGDTMFFPCDVDAPALCETENLICSPDIGNRCALPCKNDNDCTNELLHCTNKVCAL